MEDPNQMSAMGRIRARALIGVILMAVAGNCSCGDRKQRGAEPPGAILGWGARGIAVIDVPSGQWTQLLPQRQGHWFRAPAYDAQRATLYYVDEPAYQVLAWGSDDAKPRVIHQLEKGWKVARLHIDTGGSVLFFTAYRARGKLQSAVVAFDLSRQEAMGTCEVGWQIAAVRHAGGARFLVSMPPTTPGNREACVFGMLDLVSGKVTPLSPRVCAGYLLPDGQAALRFGRSETKEWFYTVHSLRTGAVVRRVSDARLPGEGYDAAATICPIDLNYAAVGRARGPMAFLGTYLLDLRTGEGRRISRRGLYSPTYLAKKPRWRPRQ